MPLSRGKVNPLGILNLRRLSFIPDHFQRVSLKTDIAPVDLKLLAQWIDFNLSSRYAIERTKDINSLGKVVSAIEVGMEDPKEITLFSLGCPYLHNQKKETL